MKQAVFPCPFKAFRLKSGMTVMLMLVGLCSAPAARAEGELVVADQKGQQKALMQASGADKDMSYPVRWVEFEAAAPLLQALGAGAVDTGIAGDGPFIFAWGAGLPIRAAWLIPPRGGGRATAVVAPHGSSITDAAQLSGKKIATGRGSIGHLLLLRLLATGAIPAPAPKLVFLLPAQAKAALDTGRVDAWSTWEPYISLAVVAGQAHVVRDARNLMPNNSFFVASTDALTRKRASLADFYRRVTTACAWGARHQADYAHILARQTDIPEDVAVSVAEKLIATPMPVTSDTVRSEAAVAEVYRANGFVTRSDAFEEAFERNLTPP
ncbi:ABC transporter substrate-binding protein [Acetobacter persici]|uniref:ABC transporter substrate-binding protein n=1 Tax=Acetobacter persici TaxID=1076596 RepID=UPI0039EAB568